MLPRSEYTRSNREYINVTRLRIPPPILTVHSLYAVPLVYARHTCVSMNIYELRQTILLTIYHQPFGSRFH